jgi:hypothetical protein
MPRNTADDLSPRIRTYELHDRSGLLVALHERHDESDGTKRFAFRQPDGTLGLGGLPTKDLPLFAIER